MSGRFQKVETDKYAASAGNTRIPHFRTLGRMGTSVGYKGTSVSYEWSVVSKTTINQS